MLQGGRGPQLVDAIAKTKNRIEAAHKPRNEAMQITRDQLVTLRRDLLRAQVAPGILDEVACHFQRGHVPGTMLERGVAERAAAAGQVEYVTACDQKLVLPDEGV